MAEQKDRVLYDTWHGVTVCECFACGEFFDADHYKFVCPECARDCSDVEVVDDL